MDDNELKNIWQSYDQQLEQAKILNLQSWALHLHSFETLQTHKAKSKLRPVQNIKLAGVVIGILWIAFLSFLLVHSFAWQKIFFVISVAMIILFTAVAIIIYIKHIILIRQIDNSESIVDTQEKLSTLQASTIQTGRILWLQAPFYTTFFWTPAQFNDLRFWLISIPVTLMFTYFSIWLYRHINYANREKKWFKIMFNSPEWTSVARSIEFIEEIDEFKKNM